MYGTLHCHVAIFSRAITLTGQVSEDPLLWAQQPARTGGDGIAADRVSRTHFFVASITFVVKCGVFRKGFGGAVCTTCGMLGADMSKLEALMCRGAACNLSATQLSCAGTNIPATCDGISDVDTLHDSVPATRPCALALRIATSPELPLLALVFLDCHLARW